MELYAKVGILKTILKFGIIHTYDALEERRLVFFNYLILFCIVTITVLVFVTFYFNFFIQALICGVGLALFVLLLLLNRGGNVNISKYLFLIITSTIITIGTLVNHKNGYFVDSENLLLPLMAITMFIFDGKKKHFSFWLVFGIYLWLKIVSVEVEGTKNEFHFILTVLNSIIVGIVTYVSLVAFRIILVKALHKSETTERRLFSMVDNVPVFLALVDKHGKYILTNENYAASLKISRKEIIGKNRSEMLPAKILENQKEFFERAQQGEAVSFFKKTRLPNGTIISANGKYEPIFDEEREVEAITICIDDVTPMVKTQEELKVANETKDKLFSIIAHDIKSPLNMFQTFLNVSNQADMSLKEFFKYQEILKQKLTSLTGTVNELLDWSRMQLGGINAYPAMVNVCDVVNENIDLFDSLIKKKNIEFKVNASCNVSAWIDENHFKVAIRNLIHNAIKFTNEGGTVEILSNQNEKETIIKVADTGIGMDSETINSIIKKEIQDSQAGTQREMGTGLGLSLSIGLLEKNNCDVSVKSEINKGTTFEIKIPNHSSVIEKHNANAHESGF
ncbi:MAG: PAS domain-containing sensor histidine kinase [Ekhidna sp.]|nr:PAS domain-containing sensor histidine kinase [Ekhidna sp.]